MNAAQGFAARQLRFATVTTLNLPSAPRPLLSIRPPKRWAPLSLRELWQYRDLLVTLAERDVTLRYRQTALGIVWVVLQPLMTAAIFVLVFARIGNVKYDVPPMLFCFAGMIAFTVFNSTVTKASACIIQNSQLVSKVYFPRLVLPLSTVLSTLIDFGVGVVLMAILMAVYRVVPPWQVLLLPVWLVLLIIAAVGVGLYTSALMVKYRDLQYVIPPLLQFLLYASPVGYPASKVPASIQPFYFLNPLAGLLEAFRWSLLGHTSMHWGYVAYAAAAVLVVFFLGAVSFARMARRFADVI